MTATATTLPARELTPAEARAITRRIRRKLADATGDLVAAWRGRVWVALGHATFEAYCDAEFGDLLKVRLPIEERRERVLEAARAGATARAIAPMVGASKSVVAEDVKALIDEGRLTLATVTDLSGRIMRRDKTPITPVTETPAKVPTTVDRVVDLVAAAGPDGMTARELGRRLRWHHGQTSGALSRAERRGKLVRVYPGRDGFGAYVIPTR